MKWLCVFAVLFACGMPAIPATPAPATAAAHTDGSRAKVTVKETASRRKCKCWGRVLDIRPVPATATTPASYEFTVRLHGGALQTTSSSSLGSWRVGDRIMLYGIDPPSVTPATQL